MSDNVRANKDISNFRKKHEFEQQI